MTGAQNFITESVSDIARIRKAKFDRVQAEKARRSNIETDFDGVKRKSTHYSMKKLNNPE